MRQSVNMRMNVNISLKTLLALLPIFYQSSSTPVGDGLSSLGGAQTNGKTWALLIAGTNGWTYYRHQKQANVCHAYKVLAEKYKIPKDRIITMMYDDVANDARNPFPGTLKNEPNGPDVYKGVVKDYTGEVNVFSCHTMEKMEHYPIEYMQWALTHSIFRDVNLITMNKILSGDKKGLEGKGSGKVIEPDPKNRIFIFFTGTGGKGGFSRLIHDSIWADVFSKTLIDLRKSKKFKKALVFWESSHSGNMFEYVLPYNSGVLAMTSTASSEDSFGWYCNVDNLPVCLAGHFSFSWISAAEQDGAEKLSIFEHYNAVRIAVNTSHPNLYGSFKLGTKKLNYFIGPKSTVEDGESVQESDIFSSPNVVAHDLTPRNEQFSMIGGIAEKDIPTAMLEYEVKTAKSKEEKALKSEELVSLKKKRNFMESTMDSIVDYSIKRAAPSTPKVQKTNYSESRRCFKRLAVRFQNTCFNYSNYYVDHILPRLFDICKSGAESEGHEAMSTICTPEHRSLNYVV